MVTWHAVGWRFTEEIYLNNYSNELYYGLVSPYTHVAQTGSWKRRRRFASYRSFLVLILNPHRLSATGFVLLNARNHRIVLNARRKRWLLSCHVICWVNLSPPHRRAFGAARVPLRKLSQSLEPEGHPCHVRDGAIQGMIWFITRASISALVFSHLLAS